LLWSGNNLEAKDRLNLPEICAGNIAQTQVRPERLLNEAIHGVLQIVNPLSGLSGLFVQAVSLFSQAPEFLENLVSTQKLNRLI